MAFYRLEGAMGDILHERIRELEQQGRPGLAAQLSVCWLRYDRSLIGRADSLSDPQAFWTEPVSGGLLAGRPGRLSSQCGETVVLAGVEAWLQARLIEDGSELRRAMADMIRDSSNDATSLLVDVLSGTSSGPALPEAKLQAWIAQRQLAQSLVRRPGLARVDGLQSLSENLG